MLYTPEMIVGWMKKYILFKKMGVVYPECSNGIELLSDYHTVLNSNNLYVGDNLDVLDALKHKAGAHQELVLLSSGTNNELETMNLAPEITLICFDLDIVSLYNKVHHYVHEFFGWDRELERAMYSNNSLQALLEQANINMKTSMILLNAGYRVLAESRNPDIPEPILDNICETGMMNYDQIKQIVSDLAKTNQNLSECDEVEYLASHSGFYSFIWNVNYNNKTVARLVMVLNQREPSPFYRDFGRVIVQHISEFFLSGHSINYSQNEIFGTLVADLIEGRILRDDILEERLKPIQLAFDNYYHLLIVSFEDANIANGKHSIGSHTHLPWNYIISQFEQLFPFSNITTYKNELIILHRKNSYDPILSVKNEAGLNNLLEQYNGFIMLGNFSKFMSSLASIYHQTEDAFLLAREMTKGTGQRIFQYEDYSIYQFIDTAVTGMLTRNGLSNPIYLCPPALVSLYRYDLCHDTNFCHILRTYLNCDRNAAETARALFMHRNTMLYNIQKIENILGRSLDDITLRSRLIIGFYVMDYVEKYMKYSLTNLRPNLINDK